MAITVTVDFPQPKKKRVPMEYVGEAQARLALGRCYIYHNQIGKVDKIEKQRGKGYWAVLFQSMYMRHRDLPFYPEQGLEDGFVNGCRHVINACEFDREAKLIDPSVLEQAKEISRKAGEELDKLIATHK